MKKDSTKTTRTTITKTKGTIENYFVESIIIDSKPFFLAFDYNSEKIGILEKIITDTIIYIPKLKETQGYIPYLFTNIEIQKLIENPPQKQELLDKIKNHIDKFLVLEDNEKAVILGDVLLSYCQEWIDTVHYLFFVGENGSGKSTGCHFFRYLGYRCMYSEDISPANIYNFLGTDEEGTGMIAEDEAHELDEDKTKLRIYKNGYAKGSKIPKISQTTTSKKQEFYMSFCFKVFSGERIPKDKGFVQRIVEIRTMPSTPKSYIKRATKEEKQDLLQLRNKLLFWKLINTVKSITRIKSGLEQRDQEHWEDFLSCVYNTTYYDRCKKAAVFYTEKKHDTIQNSFEATIFRILLENIDGNYEIKAEKMWNSISENNPLLPGEKYHHLDNTFYPHDYEEKITRNSLYKLLKEKFGCDRRKINRNSHQVTIYKFKKESLMNLAKIYKVKFDSKLF